MDSVGFRSELQHKHLDSGGFRWIQVDSEDSVDSGGFRRIQVDSSGFSRQKMIVDGTGSDVMQHVKVRFPLPVPSGAGARLRRTGPHDNPP